jgi:hypothetical protein
LFDDSEDGGVTRDRASDHVGKDADDIVVKFKVGHAVERCGKEGVFA